MTVLSLLRLAGVTADFEVPKDITRESKGKLSAIVISIFSTALTIAMLPAIKSLEDFFINGVKYEQGNSLFLGCPDKKAHMAVFKEYYGRISLNELTWSEIERLINIMFSNDYGGINRRKLSFYGNDAVCLFKYFVTRNDPQRNYVFLVLGVNFLCFIAIAIAYVTIAATARKSSDRVVLANAETAKKNNAQLQRITRWIISTDFVCWVPFIIICCCHFTATFDATPWYSYFSILVLPINSVINPILYDGHMRTVIHSKCSDLRLKLVYLLKKNRIQDIGFGDTTNENAVELEMQLQTRVDEPQDVTAAGCNDSKTFNINKSTVLKQYDQQLNQEQCQEIENNASSTIANTTHSQ
jgi:hypothetical protein